MPFNNIPLVLKQNTYAIKIVNAYIVYDLDSWSKISLKKHSTLKNCFFGATNMAKNSDKSRQMYNDYGTAFDGKGEWNFGNDSARNVVIFRVDNCSSSHTDNCKNHFLVLGEGKTFGINGSLGAPGNKVQH